MGGTCNGTERSLLCWNQRFRTCVATITSGKDPILEVLTSFTCIDIHLTVLLLLIKHEPSSYQCNVYEFERVSHDID
jgi:hypothetical protein